MDTEQNKRTAVEFLTAAAAHDGERFASLLCDDATYWTCGKPHLFDYCGEKSRDEIVAFVAAPSIFVGGAEIKFGEITAEDNRVAIETETRGELPDGRIYTNVYHYLITFRDGKVLKVKEYLDTQSAAEFFSRNKC